MDYTTITDAVDRAGVLAGLGVVAVAIAGLMVTRRGARLLLGFMNK